MTPFRTRKLGRLFDALDVDGDGFIGRSDFVRRVNALARLRNWHASSASYERNLRVALAQWQSVRKGADDDDDARVSRTEYLAWAESALVGAETVAALAADDVQLLFDAMDADGDGRISLAEYRTWLEVCNLDAGGAETFFAHADVDVDGRVSREEMANAVAEYLASEDPAAAGNFLFGAV